MTRIIDLDFKEAKKFFLKQESYFTSDLPPYLKFEDLLLNISWYLDKKKLPSLCKNGSISKDFDKVNYVLLSNKDGEYDWRPLQLIHPVLYISLLHEITDKDKREQLTKLIKKYEKNSIIKCLSLPIETNNSKSYIAKQIKNWRLTIEQKSIELSLDYNYLFKSDIIDCYWSIYTHSISRAIHGKKFAKEHKNRTDTNLIGNIIDRHLQYMSNWQTNWIPQWSVLMDLLAEIVLYYIDDNITKKIKEKWLTNDDFKILRFRDDYRIFVNDPQEWKEIIKIISEILADMWMKLNSNKTNYSDDIISSSIKSDKTNWLSNKLWVNNIWHEILFKKNKELNIIEKINLQKWLLIIYDFSLKFPNSGTLIKQLEIFFQKIENIDFIRDIPVLISILTNISIKNPRSYPIFSAILSKLFDIIPQEEIDSVNIILNKIKKKFKKIPNTEYLDIRLQRIFIKNKRWDIKFSWALCKIVFGENINIWNSDWINDKQLKKIINKSPIVDVNTIHTMPDIININEYSPFWYKY